MKEIPLTQGKVALVDDEDYDKLSKYKWCAQKCSNLFYAVRHTPRDSITYKQHRIYMHVVITNALKGLDTDHINGNGLDNRRENLRVVTHRENLQNMHIQKSSKYPGVCWHKKCKKWQVRIQVNNKRHHLGYYSDEEMAARRYYVACDWEVIDL